MKSLLYLAGFDTDILGCVLLSGLRMQAYVMLVNFKIHNKVAITKQTAQTNCSYPHVCSGLYCLWSI